MRKYVLSFGTHSNANLEAAAKAKNMSVEEFLVRSISTEVVVTLRKQREADLAMSLPRPGTDAVALAVSSLSGGILLGHAAAGFFGAIVGGAVGAVSALYSEHFNKHK